MVNYTITYKLGEWNHELPIEELTDEEPIEAGDYIVFDSVYSYTADKTFAKVFDVNEKRIMVELRSGIKRNMFYKRLGDTPMYVQNSLRICGRQVLRQKNLKYLLKLDPVESSGRLDIVS
jgi:hypothetical protein